MEKLKHRIADEAAEIEERKIKIEVELKEVQVSPAIQNISAKCIPVCLKYCFKLL